MAHLVSYIGSIAAGDGSLVISGVCLTSDAAFGDQPFSWSAEVKWDASEVEVSDAILAAAKAAAEAGGKSIGLLDRQMVLTGAKAI